MAKQWYYRLMGEEIGPISSAVLKQRAEAGQVSPDTPVRLATSDRWQRADRLKGLFPEISDMSLPPAAEQDQPSYVGVDPFEAAAAEDATPSAPAPADPVPAVPNPVALNPSEPARPELPTVEMVGDSDEDDSEADYDFFRFVGFEQAISTPLFAEVQRYANREGLNLTQVTRRALAEFVGKPELAEPAQSDESDEAG